MKISIINNLIINFMVIFCTIIISFFPTYGTFATNILIPLCFVYFIFFRLNSSLKFFNKSKALKLYLFFIFIAASSYFTSPYPSEVIITNKRMLIVLIFSLVLYSYTIFSEKNIMTVYKSFFMCFIILIIYMFFNFDYLDNSLILDFSGDFDRNSVGYFVFIGLFSWYMFSDNLINSTKSVFIISLILMFISIYLCVISASRGALITLLLFVMMNYWYFIYGGKNLAAFLLSTIIIVFSVILFLDSDFFTSSYSYNRFLSMSEFDSPREFHFFKAIEIGLDNPIFGVGSGGYSMVPKIIEYGSFSHSSYSESFANYGFMGLTLIIYFFYNVFNQCRLLYKKSSKRYKRNLERIMIFLICFFIYNFFYVCYLTSEFLGILFVVIAHIETIKYKITNA